MHSKRPDLFLPNAPWDNVHAKKKKKVSYQSPYLALYTMWIDSVLASVGLIPAVNTQHVNFEDRAYWRYTLGAS